MDDLSSQYISKFAREFQSATYIKHKFARDIQQICKNLYDQNHDYILSCISPSRSKQLHYNIFCTHILVSTLFLAHLLFDYFATESYTKDENNMSLLFVKTMEWYREFEDHLRHCKKEHSKKICQPTIGLGTTYSKSLKGNYSLTYLYNKAVIQKLSLAYRDDYQIAEKPPSECNLVNYVDQYPYDLPVAIPLTTITFDILGILLSNIILAGHLARIFMTKLNINQQTRNCANYFYSLQSLTNYLPTLVDYFAICGSILSINPIDTIPLLAISAKNVATQPKTVRVLQETEKLNQVLKKLTNKPSRPKNPNRNNYLCLVILLIGILSNLVYTNIKSKKLLMYNTKETIDTNNTHMFASSFTLIVLGFVLHFVLKVTNTNKSKNQKMLEFTYSKQ